MQRPEQNVEKRHLSRKIPVAAFPIVAVMPVMKFWRCEQKA
jgi:hypothetical protein